MTFQIHSDQRFAEQITGFFRTYNIEKLAFPLATPNSLKPKKERVCRFCGKTNPAVKFRKEAHLLPEFLGNRTLKSDFECDDCNELFAKYENSFSKYLGVNRSLFGIKGKKGIPDYNSSDLKAAKRDFIFKPNATFIERKDESLLTDLNLDTGEIYFTYNKEPYIPLYIYKLFVKIGLCLVAENEINDFSTTLKFLNEPQNINLPKEICQVFGYTLSSYVKGPVAILLKKANNELLIPKYSLLLFSTNTLMQIFIWGNSRDLEILNSGRSLNLNITPPFSLNDKTEHLIPLGQFNVDLFELEARKGEEQIIKFQLDQEALKNLVALNPETGEHQNGDVSTKIKQLIIAPLHENDKRNPSD
jgi:hypothetical protein